MAYVVKKGDNLTKIAKQNGLTLKQLLSLNKNIENPDYIQIGQKINLETKSPTGKSAYDNNDGYPTTPVKKNTPTWDRITKGAGNPATVANFNKTPEKKAPIKKQVTQKEEPGFLDSMKNKIYETYQDAITAIDQQTSKKVVAKPKVKIDDSFIDYGYKELGTYKDQSFKAGKNDSLLSAMNVFDNDKGFDYIVSPKVKEGKKTFNNVKGVAHFLMDSDITPNQKYTTPYIEKGNNIVKSAQAGKFTPYLGTSPDDYVMYYKNTGNDKVNVKYGQLKDKDKYKGYEQIKVRSVPFGELDFNNKKSAGFAKKASYIGTLDGEQTSIITDPESNEVYGRFSGGSGIFYFKEPKTGKTISVDVSGSVNTIKQVGEELSKKYNVDPKQLQFLYHDMGSYSAKPKSHNGVLSNEQWQNYNVNNKGYSGAALMYPMEFGGMAASDNVDMGYYSNPLKYFAAMGINISDDDCLECGGKVYANNGLNIDSTLNANKNLNWVQRLYQKNTPTIFLPGESHPSTHYMENADNFVYPTIIQNEDGKLEYLGNKAYDYAMKTNTAIKFKTPEEAEYFAKNYKKGKGVLKKFNMGGKIKAEDGLNPKPLIPPKLEQIDFEMERQLPPDASYERDVRKFSWNNRDTDPEQIKLDSSYMLYKKPKGYSNVYNKGKLIGYTVDNKILIPGEPNFQNGGIVKAWIQKFSNGGYIADEGFPAGQELTQPTTNYYNWGNYGNQNSFLTLDQINQKPFENPYQNMNLQQPNVPQFNIPKGKEIEPLTSIGAQKMTPDLQGIRNRVNQSMQDIAPESKSPMNMNAVNMGLDIGTQPMSVAANLMGSLGKDNSKAQAFGQGATRAMNVASQVTAPFKDIPIAGKAIDAVGKTLGFFIGGALEARRQGIENEEMDKYNKLQEYTSRNTQTAQQPSYYGQYMSKYGSNIKNLEQRLVDDIFSDYDKFMKLT